MKGFLFATSTVVLWSLLNVLIRYFLMQYNINIIVFSIYMLFSTGVSLMIIGKQIPATAWFVSVKYSWLYTIMQIVRTCFLISSFLYISSSESSLLCNIEIVFTLVFVWIFLHRAPRWGDYVGSCIILIGIVAFILALKTNIQSIVIFTISMAAIASCVRSIVVEKTTLNNPKITVLQKCGVSGYTLFIGGWALLALLMILANFRRFLNYTHCFYEYIPDFQTILYAPTIISACLSGFFINTLSIYCYYSTLKFATSEKFMGIRAFQPMITFGFEASASIFYIGMLPDVNLNDLKLAFFIILGAFFVLIARSKKSRNLNIEIL